MYARTTPPTTATQRTSPPESYTCTRSRSPWPNEQTRTEQCSRTFGLTTALRRLPMHHTIGTLIFVKASRALERLALVANGSHGASTVEKPSDRSLYDRSEHPPTQRSKSVIGTLCLAQTSLTAFFLAMVTIVAAVSVQAQPTPNASARALAREAFRAGVAAYTQGQYARALEHFQRAYQLAPHPSVRVNIANCYLQLHQPVEALTHFEHFLLEARQLDPSQRTEIERQIAELRRQIAEVRVRIRPEGVHDPIVSVDGRTIPRSEVVRITPGRHTIEVSADGYNTERIEIVATAGMQREVSLQLRAAHTIASDSVPSAPPSLGGVQREHPQASTNTTPEPPSEPIPSRTSSITSPASFASTTPNETDLAASTSSVPRRGLPPVLFYTSAVATGVGAVTWGLFGALALSENSTFEDAARRIQRGEGDYTSEYNRGRAAASNARTFALVSDGALVFTVAAAATTAILFVHTRFEPPVAASATVDAHGATLSLGGRF